MAVLDQGGIRAAAGQLALSPSATSRRVATLEAFLGAPLFDRTDSGLRPTVAARRYYDQVAPAVRAIGRASIMTDTAATRITIATSHSVAIRWLMPRAADLLRDTGLHLDVLPTRDPDVLRSGEAQFGLWGATEADDLSQECIIDVSARPVVAPRSFDGRNAPASLAEMLTFPLLAPAQPAGVWSRWLAQAGLSPMDATVIDHATMALAYEAANAGLGIALAIPMLCERELISGALVPCGPIFPIGERYILYSAQRRFNRTEPETRLLHWLRREAASSVQRFMTAAD